MTVDEVLSHFPEEVPAEFIHEANNHRPIYLFQTDKEGNTVCGNCGSSFRQYHKHFAKGECPCCHKQAIAVHMTKYHKSEAQSLRKTLLTYHWAPSIKNPDILTCTVILSCHWFSSTKPWESEPYRYVDARYIFIPNKGGYYIARSAKFRHSSFYAGGHYGTYWGELAKAKLTLRKSCRDRANVYGATSKVTPLPYPHGLGNAVKGHTLQYVYASMKEFINNTPSLVQVMHMVAKYPLQIEYLAKSEFKNTVQTSLGADCRLGEAFNMRARTFKGILRGKFPKADMEYVKRYSVSIHVLRKYQKLRKHPAGAGITLEMVDKELDRWLFCELKAIMKYVKLIKALSYIKKEKSSLITYIDYLRDCEILEMDFTEKATLFPKNLEELHVKLQKQIKRKKDEEAERKWIERRKKLEDKYEYKADGYAIVVPIDVNDLIREGKDMHNCVGGYISRVADGKTDVVYIRDTAEIDKSLGTMEIKDGHIIQARGKYNKDLPKEVQDFAEKFRKEVLEKKGRKTV